MRIILAAILFTGCAAAPVKRDWSQFTMRQKVDAAMECLDYGKCEPAPGVRFVKHDL